MNQLLLVLTKHFLAALFLVFFSIELCSQTHMPVFPDLEGDTLFTELTNEFTTLTVLNYSEARDTMYGKIYNVADSVTCVYSGHTLYLPPGVDPSIHLFTNGSPDGINAEHTYPRSKGADQEYGNGYSDLHHLFPTRVAVNEARGNSPLLEIEDSLTTSWFYLTQEQDSIPLLDTALYSERIDSIFEPREDFKGNVARAIFYFFTIYKESALTADSSFFELQRETLCDWHHQDPVDSLEWERTFMISAYQDSIPNPFVLDSSLAYRTYCDPLPLALPVTLNFFKAFEKKGTAELTWQTMTEINNHGFEIERRTDHQSWKTIGFINGNGTTRLTQDYSFIDKHTLSGNNYYRLKQIDFDEKLTYSKIVSVNISPTSQPWVDLYPNPTTGIFTINLPHLQQETHLRIFDALGQQVSVNTFRAMEQTASVKREIFLPNPGMYFVVVEIDGQVQTQKMMVKIY